MGLPISWYWDRHLTQEGVHHQIVVPHLQTHSHTHTERQSIATHTLPASATASGMLFGFLGVKLMIAHDRRATSAIVGVKLLLTMIVHLALIIVLVAP